MKIALTALTLSVFAALTACQTQTANKPSHTPVSEVKHVNNNALQKTLSQYTWAYQPENSDTPIVLSFFEDKRMLINTGCNDAFGGYQLSGNTLEVKNLASTMKLCSDELMSQERFAISLFDNKKQTLEIAIEDVLKPVLTIKDQDGKVYQFIGTQTPETKYQGQAEIIFLEISPELKDCVGVVPQKCMQVREIKYNDQGLKTSVGEWTLFYDQIQGFEHHSDQRNVVRVKRFTIKNPAADQSKYAYVHDLTVESGMVK